MAELILIGMPCIGSSSYLGGGHHRCKAKPKVFSSKSPQNRF